MLAEADPTVVAAGVAASGLVIVALVNLIGGHSSRKRIETAIDTGNGTPLGPTVYKLSGAVEVVIAQLHQNTRETLELGQKLDHHIAQVEAQSQDYFENVKPVVDRRRVDQGKAK